MQKQLKDILPIFGVEHNCILSKQGDITIAWEVNLPELFTLSDLEYEAFHQALIKAIKILPIHTVFHKQDWFTHTTYKADFTKEDKSFLSRSSERFFNERPYLDHQCYMMLTKKPAGRKVGTSLFSNLLRKSIVPDQVIKPGLLQDFMDSAGQFERILLDSGFIKLQRLTNGQLSGSGVYCGLIERYMNLHPNERSFMLNDISYKDGIKV